MTKHSKKKIKLRVKDPKRLATFVLIIILIIAIIITNKNKIKKKENMSLLINNENVTQQLENEIIIRDNIQYLSINDVKKCLDENIYQEDEIILTGSNKKIAAIELDKSEIEINGSTIEMKGQAFKSEQGTIYLPISEMQNVYDIEFSYIEEYKNIIIDSYSKRKETADLKKTVFLKEKMSGNSANLEKLQKGDWVVYISEQNDWAKVRTQNGNVGFVNKNVLTNFVVEREEMQESEKVSSDTSYYEKDITKKNIEKYKNRKSVIEEILTETINKKKQAVKIIYKNSKDTDRFKRFEIEATAFLKECGISVVFE